MAVVITPPSWWESKIPQRGSESRKARGKNACLDEERDGDGGMERKESETSRDGERQRVMEGGLQMGNEMSWEFSE